MTSLRSSGLSAPPSARRTGSEELIGVTEFEVLPTLRCADRWVDGWVSGSALEGNPLMPNGGWAMGKSGSWQEAGANNYTFNAERTYVSLFVNTAVLVQPLGRPQKCPSHPCGAATSIAPLALSLAPTAQHMTQPLTYRHSPTHVTQPLTYKHSPSHDTAPHIQTQPHT